MKLPFIWRTDGDPEPNTWTYFRRIFDWKPGQKTKLLFAADPTARLWINGAVVSARVMRFASPHITVEDLDVASYLRPGRNVAVILHHWWGVLNFQRSTGGDAGIAIDSPFLRTDARWKWHAADEFLHHPHQVIGANTKRIRFPVVLDARRELKNIHQPDFPEKGWRNAAPEDLRVVVIARSQGNASAGICRNSRQENLCQRLRQTSRFRVALRFPPVPMSWMAKNGKLTRSAKALSAPQNWLAKKEGYAELRGGRDGYVNLDFGKPLHGYVRIEVESAPAGLLSTFFTANCG